MQTVLITGTSRGLGLALTRHYAAEGWQVIACCRQPEKAEALRQVRGNVLVRRMDVTQPEQVHAVAEEFRGKAIDLLINNAGVFGPGVYGDGSGTPGQTLGSLDYQGWMDALGVNVLGPLRVAEALLPSLEKAPRPVVATMSSIFGSVASLWSGNYYVSRSAKAALNMAMSVFARDVQPRNVISVVFHPGWMKTDMGGPHAPVEVADSVRGVTSLISRLEPKDSGRFLQFDGAELPW